MKAILFLTCVLLSTATGCTSEPKADTPEAVITKFNSLYSNTSNVTWEKEDTLYEATFTVDTIEKSVAFYPSGEVHVMETEIRPDQVPQSVKDYVANQLGGKPVTGATLIVFVDGTTQYEVEVENKDYLFDTIGQFVSVEEEESAGEKEE